MGRLGIVATKFDYQEMDRWLEGQFINGLNNDSMLVEIIVNLQLLETQV